MTGFFEKKTPARGGTRRDKKSRPVEAAIEKSIAQKPDSEIWLHYFALLGGGAKCPPSLTLGSADAKVLAPIGQAGAKGYLATREQVPIWSQTVNKLRDRYSLPISEWHCKGGAGKQRGSRLYILHVELFAYLPSKHTRSALTAILAEEGGTQ